MQQMPQARPALFTASEVRARATDVLVAPEATPEAARHSLARRGDYDLNPDMTRTLAESGHQRPAAVLVPIVDRGAQATVLLTQRTEHLPSPAGQIAFPGGKVEDHDDGAIGTALRETREEIGLEPGFVDIIGFLDDYQTATGFRVTPAVAIVTPGFTLSLDNTEVADVFEVPLGFLMDTTNHEMHAREWKGAERRYYAIPYGKRYIWGATAGILRNLYDWLYR